MNAQDFISICWLASFLSFPIPLLMGWWLTSNILSPAPVHKFTYLPFLSIASGDIQGKKPLAARSLRRMCICLVLLCWLTGELKLLVLWCLIFSIALKRRKKVLLPWSITHFEEGNALSMHAIALCWFKCIGRTPQCIAAAWLLCPVATQQNSSTSTATAILTVLSDVQALQACDQIHLF